MSRHATSTQQKLPEEQRSASAEAHTPLRQCVQHALENYLHHLEGDAPHDLYSLVMKEVEPPLLEVAVRYARGNQSRAAELLGMNRATLRKKLRHYGLGKP
jgi:Fis family transcriptional regulator